MCVFKQAPNLSKVKNLKNRHGRRKKYEKIEIHHSDILEIIFGSF